MMINRLTTDRVSLGETARGNTNEKTTQQTSRFVVWSFFACLINDCHRDIVLNFCKEFCVKTFFRKDRINNRLRNVIFNTNFMFGNTFCYVRGTISNCKVRPVVINHRLQHISCSVILEFYILVMRDSHITHSLSFQCSHDRAVNVNRLLFAHPLLTLFSPLCLACIFLKILRLLHHLIENFFVPFGRITVLIEQNSELHIQLIFNIITSKPISKL